VALVGADAEPHHPHPQTEPATARP
jgi:hypothetical protein